MLPRVIQAKPHGNYEIEVVFDNHETKIFDVSPYLELGIFKELKDRSYFNSVTVEDGTILWKNGQDFCPDTLYVEGRVFAPTDASLAVREKPPEKYGK